MYTLKSKKLTVTHNPKFIFSDPVDEYEFDKSLVLNTILEVLSELNLSSKVNSTIPLHIAVKKYIREQLPLYLDDV